LPTVLSYLADRLSINALYVLLHQVHVAIVIKYFLGSFSNVLSEVLFL